MTKATELREFANLLTVASGQIQFDTDIKISGDLITTGNTINITADTLNISDPNITLASGAANSAVADGAGITVDLGTDGSAALEWHDGNQRFEFNKAVYAGGNQSVFASALDAPIATYSTDGTTGVQFTDSGGSGYLFYRGADNKFYISGSTTRFSIGYSDPNAILHVGGTASNIGDETNPAIQVGNSSNYRFGIYTTAEGAVIENKNGDDGITLLGKYAAGGVKVDKNGNLAIGSSFVGSNSVGDHALDVDGAIATRQVRHSTNPILNLDFANTKKLDSRIRFSRNSIATYYNEKGEIAYAGVNEPRFDHDPVTHECKGLLIENNETNVFNWTNRPEWWPLNSHSSGAHYYEFQSMKSPDGTYNATKIIIAGGDPYFYQNGLSLNGEYTFSYWIKAVGNAVGKHYTTRITNVSSNQNIADTLPSEWTRKEITFTTSSTTTAYIGIEAPDNSPADGDIVSIWGAQLETRDYASSYMPSIDQFTSRSTRASYRDKNGTIRFARENTPRYSHVWDGQSWQPTGLLLERGATNLGTDSERLSNSTAWTLTQGFVEKDEVRAITAPDGGHNVWAFVANTNNTSHNFREAHSGLTANAEYTLSWWMRPKGTLTEFGLYAAGPNTSYVFDSMDGSSIPSVTPSGTSVRHSIKLEDNGWYRCIVTVYANSSGVINPIFTLRSSGSETFTGDGVNGLYFWGYQIERGTAATSYIRTYGSTVARGADIATSDNRPRVSDYALLYLKDVEGYNADNWNILHEIEDFHYIANSRLISLDDNTLDNRIAPQTQSTTQIRVVSFINGDVNVNSTTAIVNNWQDRAKYAFGIGDSQYTLAVNGTVYQDAAGAIPIRKVTQLRIGGLTEGYTSNGCHRKVVLYPEKLTNAELVALTENN